MVGVTNDRPTPVSSVLSILAGAASVALVATGSAQRLAILVVLVGSLVMLVGFGRWVGGDDPVQSVALGGVGMIGLGIAAFGVGLGATRPFVFDAVAEVVPGLLGVAVLTLGVAGVWTNKERLLITAGAGLIVGSVILSALMYGASVVTLLIAGVAAVVAWDVGEQAVNLSEQVGSTARTLRAEFAHAGGTAVVGVVAVVLAVGVRRLQVTNLSLEALVVFLGAGLFLTVALYN